MSVYNVSNVDGIDGNQEDETMKTAYIELVKKALYLGYTVSVWDGEEWQVKRSNLYKAIVDAIESVEEAQVRFRDCAGEITGWALIIPFGVDPDETLADYQGEWIDSI